MNVQPHTHRVEVHTTYSDGTGSIRVEYGDTRKMVFKRLPFREARIKRAVRRTIAKHDRGSIRAGKRMDKRQKIRSMSEQFNTQVLQTPQTGGYYSERERERTDAWGRDILKGKAPVKEKEAITA